jgi:hypothetical protein
VTVALLDELTERAANDLRLLNPGSPTDRRRQPACTYMTATIEAESVTGVRLHPLP